MAHLPDLNHRNDRRRFLLSMQPIMRVMEERRRRNEEEAVRYTRCMARKEDHHVGKGNGGVGRDIVIMTWTPAFTFSPRSTNAGTLP